MGSVFSCKLNPCCGDRRNCNPPRQYCEQSETPPAETVVETNRRPDVNRLVDYWSKQHGETAKATAEALSRLVGLFTASSPMADGGGLEMTAAEDVLAWLLIEKIGVPDDQSYTPNQAQEIIANALATKPAAKNDETVVEALRGLVKLRKGIVSEVRTAHQIRGNGASEWMREDDRDFRGELAAAFDAAEAALAAKDGAHA